MTFRVKWYAVALLFPVLIAGLGIAWDASAQSQCDPVSGIGFPVDPGAFQIVQDFGAPSVRHDGRYHTGEDWYGGRGSSLGQPVHAIANGRVTYSSPNGWGVDGGVIIIEHTFPDGSTTYSMYGHIGETNGITFPAALACVHEGDIIGAILDVRPAPHLHFEIRTNNPDIPGAGYSWDFPTLLGWRRPSKFVLNWQMWMSRAQRWHLDLADEAGPVTPPISFSDNSLIYLDASRVSRVSADGRILWRVTLDHTAVGLIPYREAVAVVFASGDVRAIGGDGTPGESWNTGFAFDSAPMFAHDQILFHTTDGQVVTLDSTAHTVAWQIPNLPQIVRYAASDQVIGLETSDNRLITVSMTGALVDQAYLREPGALIADAGGGLLAYTVGGLWRISPSGDWTLPVPDAPIGGESAAVDQASDGRLYLYDGLTLHAYAPDASPRWSVDLPGIQGESRLATDSSGDFVILTSSYGGIEVVRASDGAVCNGGRLFGDRRSRVWSALGSDGILRDYVADQIIGLEWQRFLLGCAG